MKRSLPVFVCLVATLAAIGARAHTVAAQTDADSSQISSTPVAHVYIATPKGVDLYDADATGKLTMVAGSPFAGSFSDIVTNGKYFYGTDKTYIYEDSVAANGALTRVDKFTPASHADDFEEVGALNLDHTGSTLYSNVYVDGGMIYESYRISKSNGELVWLGDADKGESARSAVGPLHILGNDKFAFQTQNYITWFVEGLTIGSNHELVDGLPGILFPEGKSGILYNPYAVATDPSNHFALAAYPQKDAPSGPIAGPTQLAVYSIDSAGNQTTTSTYDNMPAVELGWVSDMNMSPSGELLAVAGNGPGKTGLEVFHFNGASPITKYTGLIATAPIDEVHWDKSNHLYAISKSAGKVFVFTVTPTSVTEAPGSPFSVGSPQSIIIRPL